MRFKSIRELTKGPSAFWSDLREEGELILTRYGRPVAIVTPVDESDLEDTLVAIRQALAIRLVNQLQRESDRNGTDRMTMNEIDEEIQKARRERSR
jgi:hypothetical protein